MNCIKEKTSIYTLHADGTVEVETKTPEEIEREAIIKLAAEQCWEMKGGDSFEDAVREICSMRSNVEGNRQGRT
jgi:hypothetical protein